VTSPAAARAPEHRPWRLLGALSVSETVSWGILYYAFSVFVRPMERELGWTRSETVAAFSIGLLASAVAAPWVGRWLDRRGPRLLMAAGSCLGCLLVLAWSRVQGLGAFYGIWAGLGLSMAAVLYEPAFAVVTASFTRERERALTLLTLVAGLASAIFLPLATWLTAQIGWRGALTVLAVILAVVTIPIHAVLPRHPIAEGPLPARSHPSGEEGASVRDVFQGRSFRLLAVAFVASGLATGAIAVHLVPFLLERGHPAETSAVAAGLMGAMQVPARLAFAPLRGRLAGMWVLAGVLFLQCVALGLLTAAGTGVLLVAFVVCFGAGSGLLTLARATAVSDLFGTARYGTVAGVLASLVTAARAAGPMLAAAVYGATGHYGPAFWLLALGLAVAGVAALGLRPRADLRHPRR
jgi:MFS family permease